MPNALRLLADKLGILPEYIDQTGTERRRTSDRTRQALLAAMGVEVHGEGGARRVLEELAASEAERLVPPARVLRLDEAPGAMAEVRVPLGWSGTVSWTLRLSLEEGDVHTARGEARPRAGRLALPIPLAPGGVGYHTLRVELSARGGSRSAEQSLIVVPPRCPSPREILGQRVFGIVANLYTVRSARNWGVGDLADLRELVAFAAEAGAAFVGVNPLHALRNRGADVSPYSPVTRLFRNPLYLAIDAVPEMADSERARALMADADVRAELEQLRLTPSVEYERVMALKRPVLEALHRVFAERHRGRDTVRGRAYETYVRSQGEALESFATFCAIAERGAGRGARGEGSSDWRRWPAEYRDPRSSTVAAFREANTDAVDFHRWMQFELDRQLGAAAARASELGMPVGIYQDLPIGTSQTGSDTWMFPGLFAAGVSVGAPPDEYSRTGQNWGLPPIDPRRLAADGYRYWIQLARSSFRHAGALRIDHVIGLFRQFWIPEGGSGKDGAYVRFPADDLFGILALESARARALVVGEDLGTVPPEVEPGLARWGVLSSKVLYFEKNARGFRPPAAYAADALATANTHDMPTLAGYWRARDVALKRQIGMIRSDAEAKRARRARNEELDALIAALRAEHILGEGEEITDALTLVAAVHAFLRRTPSWLVGLSLDDLVGEIEPVNLPGVGADDFPSWTRRLSRDVESLRADPLVRRALGVERAWIAGTHPTPTTSTGNSRPR